MFPLFILGIALFVQSTLFLLDVWSGLLLVIAVPASPQGLFLGTISLPVCRKLVIFSKKP